MAHSFSRRVKPKPGTTAAGYGYAHQQARRLAAAKHKPTDICSRCPRPLGPMGPWLHYDHNAARSGYLGFAHEHCNTSAGAKVGNQRQGRHRTPQPRRRRLL